MPYRVTIKKEVCLGCGNCAEACPPTISRESKAVEKDEGNPSNNPVLQIKHGNSNLVDEDGCGLCGVCIMACPARAIEIKEV